MIRRARQRTSTRLGGGITAARLSWGTVLMLAPGPMLVGVGSPDLPRSRGVARILGARHVLQGLWERRSATGRLRLGFIIDAAHVLSMLALALFDRRWRRAAVTDAAIGSAFGLGGLWATRVSKVS